MLQLRDCLAAVVDRIFGAGTQWNHCNERRRIVGICRNIVDEWSFAALLYPIQKNASHTETDYRGGKELRQSAAADLRHRDEDERANDGRNAEIAAPAQHRKTGGEWPQIEPNTCAGSEEQDYRERGKRERKRAESH